MIAACLLVLLIYLLCGLAFAVPFAWAGAGKIDPHAARATWGFRLLILPGAALLWPLLAWRWLNRMTEPPEERNAHRLAAKSNRSGAEGPEPRFTLP